MLITLFWPYSTLVVIFVLKLLRNGAGKSSFDELKKVSLTMSGKQWVIFDFLEL